LREPARLSCKASRAVALSPRALQHAVIEQCDASSSSVEHLLEGEGS
jgi:hypothetical protein